MAAAAPPAPIGLLGGSFDPIHAAHLRLAEAARDALGLAQVRFIPAGQPWQKGRLAGASERAEMVELALAGAPAMVLDRRELERDGPTYTIDTLREVRAESGPALGLVLLIGADQLQRFDTWNDWDQILDFCHLAVAPRPGEPSALSPRLAAWHAAHHATPAQLALAPAGSIVDLPMAPVDGSATEIRALLRAPDSAAAAARLAALLPHPVLDYIRAHHLYTSESSA